MIIDSILFDYLSERFVGENVFTLSLAARVYEMVYHLFQCCNLTCVTYSCLQTDITFLCVFISYLKYREVRPSFVILNPHLFKRVNREVSFSSCWFDVFSGCLFKTKRRQDTNTLRLIQGSALQGNFCEIV